ncbi:hypothetical protein B0T14DRAFT_511902 [Immersiella caudata]|uniref:Uncharacterized protein n=1 Tax=Immersiella caudata TaxID=314043 RepID=A0AA40C6N9_9PEZI|nr:hypothetical protein B0T14DRAFT_511902 [Immersiella caudata]
MAGTFSKRLDVAYRILLTLRTSGWEGLKIEVTCVDELNLRRLNKKSSGNVFDKERLFFGRGLTYSRGSPATLGAV